MRRRKGHRWINSNKCRKNLGIIQDKSHSQNKMIWFHCRMNIIKRWHQYSSHKKSHRVSIFQNCWNILSGRWGGTEFHQTLLNFPYRLNTRKKKAQNKFCKSCHKGHRRNNLNKCRKNLGILQDKSYSQNKIIWFHYRKSIG